MEKFLSSIFKVILGQIFKKRSKYGRLKLNDLHRDHPQANVIFYATSSMLYNQLKCAVLKKIPASDHLFQNSINI